MNTTHKPTAHDFLIGEEIISFGFHAIVVKYHWSMDLLIVQDENGMKWCADPAQVTRCGGWRHKDGLVTFG